MQLYLFTHVFNFIEKWTKDPSVWARLRRRHQCLSQLDESDERCHWFDRTTESVDSCRIFAPMVTYSREKQEISIWQLTVYMQRHPSVSDTCGRLHTAVSLHTGLTILRWEKRYMRVGMILKMSSVLISIGRIWWKMSLIWSDSWKRWQLSNIRPDMIFNPIILSFCHTIPCVTGLKQ